MEHVYSKYTYVMVNGTIMDYWLVVFRLPLWKIMEFGPVGMLFHSQYDGKVIIQMFETTKQYTSTLCSLDLPFPTFGDG